MSEREAGAESKGCARPGLASRLGCHPPFFFILQPTLPQAEHTASYLNFLARLPPLPSCPPPSCTAPLPASSRPLLAVDLDHTLVHAIALPSSAVAPPPGAIMVPGAVPGARTAFFKRPGVDAFLEAVSQLFDVVVFTAGARAYAAPVVAALDPTGRFFAGVRYRDACTRVRVKNGKTTTTTTTRPSSASSVFIVKDLARMGRPLARSLILDNSPTAYAYHVANAVPISSWRGGRNGAGADDRALAALLPLLTAAAAAADVRDVVQAACPGAAALAAAADAHPSLFAAAVAADSRRRGAAASRPPLAPVVGKPPAGASDAGNNGLVAAAAAAAGATAPRAVVSAKRPRSASPPGTPPPLLSPTKRAAVVSA